MPSFYYLLQDFGCGLSEFEAGEDVESSRSDIQSDKQRTQTSDSQKLNERIVALQEISAAAQIQQSTIEMVLQSFGQAIMQNRQILETARQQEASLGQAPSLSRNLQAQLQNFNGVTQIFSI